MLSQWVTDPTLMMRSDPACSRYDPAMKEVKHNSPPYPQTQRAALIDDEGHLLFGFA